MSGNKTQRSRPITKPDHSALGFRARLELLENRTLLSGGCDTPQCLDPNLPPAPTNGSLPYWVDESFSCNQSNELDVGNYLPAFNDIGPDSFAKHWFDVSEYLSWQDGGADGEMPLWMDGDDFDNAFRDPPRNALALHAPQDMNAKLGGSPPLFGENAWQNDGSEGPRQEHDPFDLPIEYGHFAVQPPNGVELGGKHWIDLNIDPVETPSRPPWRLPREVIHQGISPIVVPPSYSLTQASGAVSQPTSHSLISAQAHRTATYDASLCPARDFTRSDESSTGHRSPSAEDALTELAGSGAAGVLEGARPNTADASSAQSPKPSDEAPPVAATACDVAVAGAFAVVLSPPISRLLAAGAAPLADDAIGGTIQALWAWLRRRKAKRPSSNDTPQDLNGSDESYASFDTAIGDSFDAMTARSNLALAGGASAAGVVVIASVWSRHDSACSATGGRSHRKLVVPTDGEPTRAR